MKLRLFRSKGWTWTLAFAMIFPQLFMPAGADAEGALSPHTRRTVWT